MTAPELTRDACALRVCKAIAKAQRLPLAQLTPERSFAELGIGSLDAINIVFVLEDEFGISVPEDEMAFATIGEVVDAVHRHLMALPPTAGAQAPAGA